MPEVRLLVPIEGHGAVGDVVDVDVETASAWRAAGKVSLVTAEQAAEEAAAHGHYSDVVGREDVATPQPVEKSGGPQEDEDDDDQPKSKKGKR